MEISFFSAADTAASVVAGWTDRQTGGWKGELKDRMKGILIAIDSMSYLLSKDNGISGVRKLMLV